MCFFTNHSCYSGCYICIPLISHSFLHNRISYSTVVLYIGIMNVWGFWVYGKPGTPEQPGSARTALFLQLESHANTDWEGFTVELTTLLMISSAVAIKIVAHTQTGRIVVCGDYGQSKCLGEQQLGSAQIQPSGKSITSLHVYVRNLCYPGQD